MKKILLIILISGLIFPGFSFGWALSEEEKDAQIEKEVEKNIFVACGIEDRLLRIGMVDCIAYALKNNSDIQIKRIDPRLKTDDVKIAWAKFEPSLSGEFKIYDIIKPSTLTSFFSPIHSENRVNTFSAGIDGKLITGAQYKLDFINEKTRSNSSPTFVAMNPYYLSEPKITITQPLFRGAGIKVNTADITIAKNNKLESDELFKNTVMDVVTNTKIAYYKYIYHLENYVLAIDTWERAKDLFEINKLRYAKGLVSSVDLLETEADAIAKEKFVIAAEQSLKNAEDNLKLITNLVQDPQVWNAKIELIDKLDFKVREIDLLSSLKEAFKYRPDYNVAKIDLKNKNIHIMTAKNELLPTVDLTGSLGLNGLADTYADTIDNISTKHKEWTFGVKVTIPFGGGERAKMDQRTQEKIQAILAFKDLEQKIILDLRDRVREVNTQKRQVEASAAFKEKEAENYQAQKERYAAGQVSTHDMVDYQDRLATAELGYNVALIDYNTALLNLEKSEGLTLIKNNITLEE